MFRAEVNAVTEEVPVDFPLPMLDMAASACYFFP
jgi:hypothetical protein